jgi:DNA-binding NarL/FixJ family response regulator
MSNYSKISLVVADDHEIFRQGFKAIIGSHTELEVIGEAANGQELVQVVASLQPDIAFVDIKMPVLDGIGATREIVESSNTTRVIALSMFSDDVFIADMLHAGACGYMLKNADYSELLTASQAVMSGGHYFCKEASDRISIILGTRFHGAQVSKQEPFFSEREVQIIRFICEQLTTKEIAAALELSQRTIDTYRDQIQRKTNSKNMAGVVFYAVKNGLYGP